MNSVYGIGVIGAGVIFNEHAQAYKELSHRAKLVGLADVNAHRLDRASMGHFVPFTCTDYRDLIKRDDIDIVDICTPPSLHEEMVLAALAAGKSVICEKPLAHTLASADRIIDAAKQSPGKLTIVYQLRDMPEICRAIWLRDHGHLGPLLFGRFLRCGELAKSRPGWWGTWGMAGGGALMTQFIHEVDLMQYLFGAVEHVDATMDTLKEDIESEDTFMATVRFKSGAVATCLSCLVGHQWDYQFDIIGTLGSVHTPWGFYSGNRRLSSLKREATRRYPSSGWQPKPGLVAKVWRRAIRSFIRPKPKPSRHTPHFTRFLDAIEGKGPVPVPPEDARASLELAVAMYTSALTGKTVSLPLARTTPYYNGVTTDDYDGRTRCVVGARS